MADMQKDAHSPARKSPTEISSRQIQSVQRAINILNCFTLTNTALTLSQISSRLNLNKGTVHGILNTLHNNGYISQNSAGQYMLGAELFNKSYLASDTRRRICVDHAHDKMQSLSDRFQANSTLFAVEDGHLMVLDATEPTNSAFIIRRAMPQISLYGSASGKLLLTYLSEKKQAEYLAKAPFPPFTSSTKCTRQQLLADFSLIREIGYSYENNELFVGVSALAVPIFTQYGDSLYGTISLTGMSAAISKNKKAIVQALFEVTRMLQQSLKF